MSLVAFWIGKREGLPPMISNIVAGWFLCAFTFFSYQFSIGIILAVI